MRVEDEYGEFVEEPKKKLGFKQVREFFTRHIVDSTAILMAITPIYIFVELVILQIRWDVSLRARLVIIGLTYLGTGILIAKGRDFSKSLFGLNRLGVAEKKILTHDLLYLVAFNAVFGPIVYFLSGASWAELIRATLFAMGLSFFTGPVNGFFIDAVGELTGMRRSDRLPVQILQLGSKQKLLLFFGLLGLWIGGFVMIYNQQIF